MSTRFMAPVLGVLLAFVVVEAQDRRLNQDATGLPQGETMLAIDPNNSQHPHRDPGCLGAGQRPGDRHQPDDGLAGAGRDHDRSVVDPDGAVGGFRNTSRANKPSMTPDVPSPRRKLSGR